MSWGLLLSSHVSAEFSLFTVASTAITAAIIYWQIRKAAQKLDISSAEKSRVKLYSGVFLFGWLLLAIGIGLLDFFHVSTEFISPLVPIGFALPIFIVWKLMKSSLTFQKLVLGFPLFWLIIIQTPRIAGYAFLMLMASGQLPALFAIPSGWGDIFVGATAPIVALVYWKKFSFSRNLAILWNVVGLIDLMVAIGLGIILAFPEPFQIVQVTPTTEILTTLPMVLVPVFAVPLGILLHYFSLKKLLKGK